MPERTPLPAGPYWELQAGDNYPSRAQIPENLSLLHRAKSGNKWIVNQQRIIFKLVAYDGADHKPMYQQWFPGYNPSYPSNPTSGFGLGLEARTMGQLLKWE